MMVVPLTSSAQVGKVKVSSSLNLESWFRYTCKASLKNDCYKLFIVTFYLLLHIIYCYMLSNALHSKFFSIHQVKKKKRIFLIFQQWSYWTTKLPFCSTIFCHLSTNFLILSHFYQNCIAPSDYCSFQEKEELFLLREFCKDKNRNAKILNLVNMVNERKLSN